MIIVLNIDKSMKPEEHLQYQVKTYLDLQYPNILYKFNYADGIKLSIGQAVKNKKLGSGKAFPDLMIFEARNGYYGLFIELKVENTKLFKKDRITPFNEHIKEQIDIINKLNSRNYYAHFGIGFQNTKNIIDNYLRL